MFISRYKSAMDLERKEVQALSRSATGFRQKVGRNFSLEGMYYLMGEGITKCRLFFPSIFDQVVRVGGFVVGLFGIKSNLKSFGLGFGCSKIKF